MVIQRIQSLYLLIAAVLMGVFTFLPVFDTVVDGANLSIGALTTCGIARQSWVLLCLDVVIVALSAITIFKFKNLKFQARLCAVLMALILGLLATIAVMFFGLAAADMHWAIALPLLALVLVFLARRGILHDRKLLSDSERIR
ncbi:MAG: DUF4293 domain-containing protein [Muribaculaceae bacterium]|nr:DUF4293 domain-containing protein [Muribaculaceae bacterium]